ncbi:MAG: hypothetical protein EAZ34_08080 [Polaromonas sp.]|nr:MAG: hypothetical protein EAZ34_08080 [Polaromonas sp.]
MAKKLGFLGMLAVSGILAACGPAPAPAPGGQASVSLLASSPARFPWNLETAMAVSMKDPQGVAITSISCLSADVVTTSVKSDCTAATLKRLGSQNILVTGGGFTASLTLQGVPQRQWSGQHGVNGTEGTINLLALADGSALAWGTNGAGSDSAGLLGQNKNAVLFPNSSIPLVVLNTDGTSALSQIYQVSSGYVDAFALSEEGNVWGWGRNVNCALAQPNCSGGALLPVRLRNAASNGLLGSVVQVEAGTENQTALLDSGAVMTWGQFSGQGDTNRKDFPGLVKTPDGAAALSDIVAISAGGSFSLALAKDGRVYAWGDDFGQGRLGTGTARSNLMPLPNLVKKQDGSDLNNIISISAGNNFSLALSSDGSVWTWGNNTSGQLGQKALSASGIPFAVQVKAPAGQSGSLSNIAMVAAGGNHALALDNAGQVYAWGLNGSKQLGSFPGNLTTSVATLPTQVFGADGVTLLTGAVSIAANYTNSSVLMADGKLLMWGSNFRGALGRGEPVGTAFANSSVPAPVVAGSSLTPLLVSPAGYPNLKRISR